MLFRSDVVLLRTFCLSLRKSPLSSNPLMSLLLSLGSFFGLEAGQLQSLRVAAQHQARLTFTYPWGSACPEAQGQDPCLLS